MDAYITVSQAAQESGLSDSGIRSHISRGNLHAVKFGRDWFVDKADFERWKQVKRMRGNPEWIAKRGY